MTRIDFYSHAPDKLAATCQLAAKALRSGLRVMIYTPGPELTDALDRLLWTVPSTGFLPHCRLRARLAPVTPVLIDHEAEPLLHDQVLVNLRDEWPPFFSRFQRLIEIVADDPVDASAGRERFRQYRDRGYTIHHHDLRSVQGR